MTPVHAAAAPRCGRRGKKSRPQGAWRRRSGGAWALGDNDAAALHRRPCQEGRVTRGFIGNAGADAGEKIRAGYRRTGGERCV
jgi:hypothetical protein